jgi:hypothetical protein
MNATDDVVRNSATFVATVDLPDPDPPAIPMIRGLSILLQSYDKHPWNALCPLCLRLEPLRKTDIAMKIRSIVFALVVIGLVACAGLSRGSAAGNQNEPTVVQVDNQGFLDMTVYAARSAQRIRLGVANGNSKTNFTVPVMLVSGLTPLRFVADPIGGNRASVSEEITVAPGDTVVLTIPPM